MKGIAAVLGAGSQVNFFRLNRKFALKGTSPSGSDRQLGGVFTTVPAVTSGMAQRPPIILQSSDTAVPSAARIVVPGGPISLTQRIDLFGLGTDYGMYHKRLWGTLVQDDLSDWQGLGGDFTSAPAAIAWQAERVDVFGVGLDHAMYQKTANGETWSAEWLRLGGTFTSAATLAVSGTSQLNLFARGADFTLRGNHSDGTTWFGFENHGGNLASPPVAISWGSNRVDVFAIFNDGALWHIWWDGAIWNEWESLGGSYLSEPAAVSSVPGRLDVFVRGTDWQLHHHQFTDDAWASPEILNWGGGSMADPPTAFGMDESPTALATAPDALMVFVPTNNKGYRIGTWNGQSWAFEVGLVPAFDDPDNALRMPSRYEFKVVDIRVRDTMALVTDTDAAAASVLVGNWPVMTQTQWLGDLGSLTNQEQPPNLLDFSPVTVDFAEAISFSYLVINNGHSDQSQILASLAAGSNSLSLAVTASMAQDIANGVAKIASAALSSTVTVPVVGSILGAAGGWLLSQLVSLAFADCDGLVAAELSASIGRGLFEATNNGNTSFGATTTHRSSKPSILCGTGDCVYDVTWSITPL
jgi:hypothetical protein